MREAERLAGEGHYSEAAHALYQGVIQQLARNGQVRPHRSKTSGDYVRELRAHGSPAQQSFRRFGRRYDRILFGDGRCDAAGFEALRADAQPVIDAVDAEHAA